MIYFYYLFAIVLGYLFGSIPFGYLLVKKFHHKDLRDFGSGNIGATNVYRLSKGLGIFTFILDAIKALVAIAFTSQIGASFLTGGTISDIIKTGCLLSGFAAILGHMHSIFLEFKGGKGVSTSIGYFLYISFPMTILGLLVWIICFKFSKYSSLSSLALMGFCTIYALIFLSTLQGIVIFSTALLIIYHHKSNIHRLILGEESKIL